ncbi:Type II secretion system protein E [bacterium HR35]|nr:Type II secretion system protein E [bacterium HR35]
MKEESLISYFKEKYPKIEEWLMEAKILGMTFEEYAYNKNLIPIKEILDFKAQIYNLPIKTFEMDEVIPLEIINKIPEKTALNYKILAFDYKQNILYLGVVDPEVPQLQEKVIEVLKQNLKLQEVKIFLISIQDFYIHLEDYHNFEEELKKLTIDFRSQKGRKIEEKEMFALSQEITVGEEGPVIKMLELIIRKAVALRASDIHIEPLPDRLRIRFRLFGDLKTVALLPKDLQQPLINRVKILTNLRLDEQRIPQDARFRATVQGREIDFRVGIFPTINGEKAAIRILDPLVGLKKIQDLGLADYHYEIIKRNIRRSYGLILVTGPTGSGKTTTLNALLQEINREEINIVSLEDPVEYKIAGVNQSQVRPEIGYSFANGLREILRQDPDVILVGEIRDEETAELVTHAALTGHLVLSTLHTNTSLGAIPRLIDMGVKPYFIPSIINLVIAQRLVRQICQNCKEETDISPELKSEIKKVLAEAPPEYQDFEVKAFRGRGCEKCHFRGYIGRIGIFEMFEMTKEIAQAVSKGLTEAEMFDLVKKQNFISMRLDGIIKASQGRVFLDEIFKVT